MHICFITAEYPTPGQSNGGIGTMVKFIGEYLAKAGHDVSVIGEYSSKIGDQVENGVFIRRLPLNTRGPLRLLKKIRLLNKAIQKRHQEKRIDIIETPELGLAFLKKEPDITYVIRMNGGHHFFAEAENRPTEWKKVWKEKRSFAKADALIAVSDYVGSRTTSLLKLSKAYTVINNPLDTEAFAPSDSSLVVPGRIVFVGTLVEKKGIRQLIQAMPRIREAHPNAHLVAVGRDAFFPGTSKPYTPYLHSFLPEQHEEYITFTGAVPHSEVVNYIQTAEVCAYPSHMEALPLAWLEALGLGKPFVGGETGPGPEVIKHKETGLLCNPHEPDDIAEKINWLLRHPEAAKQMGLTARDDIMQRFSIEKLGKDNIRFFEQCI
jgi:glycosyltransferase involved in cell wall biosynthesis